MNPGAAYETWREPLRLTERLPLPTTQGISELEIQARWFAGQFPRHLKTTEGTSVEIVHLGVWNREPGPDFCEAVIRLGGNDPVRGDIELDTHRRDWETHGHSQNAAFNNVVLHLFLEAGEREFFTRTQEHRFIPQVKLQLEGDDQPLLVPPLAVQGRCSSPLSSLPVEVRDHLIESAAHFRLQKKSRAFAILSETHGWDEALFQSVAVALGYKENKLPFQLLAQRIGWKTLSEEHANIEPLLFGCAGFLEATTLRTFEPDTRDYLRALWDRWWAIRDKWQRLVLPGKIWHTSGTRPANHPQRRLAALAVMLKNWKTISQVFRNPSPAILVESLGSLTHPYWSEHYTLQSKRTGAPISLLGKTRLVEMLVNVAIPASMPHEPDGWQILRKITQPLQNRKLKTAILRLYGSKSPHVTNSVLQQQGLLQIYEDFCLRDLTNCARCPFPEKVLSWETN